MKLNLVLFFTALSAGVVASPMPAGAPVDRRGYNGYGTYGKYGKYSSYGTYPRAAEAEAEAEADADINAMLDLAFAIKDKRAGYGSYGQYGKYGSYSAYGKYSRFAEAEAESEAAPEA